MSSFNVSFRRVVTPDNKGFYIPTDIKLVFPRESLPPDLLRCLVCIPWERDYLHFVPKRFRHFFEFALPYLKPRTTNVHTAVCLSYWNNYTKKLEKSLANLFSELKRLMKVNTISGKCDIVK